MILIGKVRIRMPPPSIPFHHFFQSPLGWIGMGMAPDGKVGRLEVLPGGSSDDTLILTARRKEPRILECLKNQLADYFRLSCRTFNIPVRLAGTDLEQRVWGEALLLQFGQCVTLQVLAQRVKSASAEAVAAALRANPVAILVPTHRVLGWEQKPLEWLQTLRRLEDIVPGETTCLMPSSLPNTAEEFARAQAMATPATLHHRS